jgi:hypothetical protein
MVEDRPVWQARAAEVLEICDRISAKERAFLENMLTRQRPPPGAAGSVAQRPKRARALHMFVSGVEYGDFDRADDGIRWMMIHYGVITEADA